MRDEVLSSLGTNRKDTSGYQASTIEDNEFHEEDLDLNLEAFFWPKIDTQLLLIFRRFWDGFIGWTLIDEMQYEKNFLIQQLQSLKNAPVVPLKQKLGVSEIMCTDICVNNSSFDYDCVYELNKKIDCFNLSLSLSEMRQKTVIQTHLYFLCQNCF